MLIDLGPGRVKVRTWKRLLIAVALVAILPAAVSAGVAKPVSAGMRFVGGPVEGRVDKRIGQYFSMPAAGADVVVRFGAYSGQTSGQPVQVSAADVGSFDFGSDAVGCPGAPSGAPISRVSVRIYDRENPGRVLFSFQGDPAAFAGQAGSEAKTSTPWCVVVSMHIPVPAGQTWWIGRIEVTAGNSTGHADVALIQGGLQNWLNAHGGKW